ncbi:hypothetical protein LTR70_008607 [Exophiala xenobiotica]|uniref:Scramblase-domain-containing protein n=1 Tax=Lithohypha guttulata TaxID=1690604 RepID=A0ABR0K0D7_9EURO|nr:hypothetical protein LTR24_008316 [Lithohypha guttulata]KAK5311748.1 hypothetical protein LTR70_008607 [Exophiala xenobiotica]
MATLQSCLPRPTLQFLQVRNFRPLLSRSLRTRPSTPQPKYPQPRPQNGTPQESSPAPAQQPSISNLLAQAESANNSLLAPVSIPDDPRAILKTDHPSTSLLEQSGIVVQRQIEMMNVFLGFEQANRYVIMDPQGNHIGYMAEHDGGIAKTMGRQWFRTHRSFMVHVFGRDGQEVLRFHRPFSWINTRIRVYDPVELASGLKSSPSTDVVQSNAVADAVMNQQISSLKLEEMRLIGEAQSEWAPLRRKYNLFLAHELPNAGVVGSEAIPRDLSGKQQNQVKSQDHFAQFAYVDEPFLSWDFSLKAADEKLIGSVNRNWGGLGREFFTDTGTYVLRMDAAGLEEEAAQRHTVSQSHRGERAYAETLGGNDGKFGMTLDQRAVMLATAVTVDFDYFSRHSHGGGIIPMPLMMGGGGASEAGAAGGAAGAAGTGAEAGALGETVSGGAIGTAGRAATGVGAGEGAMAGAGTMAGYEAMQRGMGRGEGQGDPQSPQAPDPGEQYPEQPNQYDPQSPQYEAGPEQQPPPEQGGPPQEGDVWGSGESDPWAGGDNTPGEGGGESGGWISSLWDMFGGGD